MDFYKNFKNIVRFFFRTSPSPCFLQTDLSVATGKHWQIYFRGEINRIEKDLYFSFSMKRTQPFLIGFGFFGSWFGLYWGDGRHDGYDEHLDKYYDFDALEAAYPDKDFNQLEALIPYSVKKPYRAKVFYASKRLKIYSEDIANNPLSLSVRVRLPLKRSVKLSFKKPWGYAKWCGIEARAANSTGIVLSLMKCDFEIVFG